MKLWVDDIRNAPDDTWQVARSVSAAIRTIARFRDEITEISLDHDISHPINHDLSKMTTCEETFAAVAYYIAEVYMTNATLKDAPVPKITLHTSNPVGADDMKSILADAGITAEVKMMGAANRLEK